MFRSVFPAASAPLAPARQAADISVIDSQLMSVITGQLINVIDRPMFRAGLLISGGL